MNYRILIIVFSVYYRVNGIKSGDNVEGNERIARTENKDNFLVGTEDSLLIRKCCPTKNYFNIYSNECEAEDNDKTFANNIYQFLLNFENKTLLTKSQKLKECPKISQKLNLDYITNNTSHVLLKAGKVHDYDRNISFNFSQYCLEMVGDTPEMSSLVIVYCWEPQIVGDNVEGNERIARTENKDNFLIVTEDSLLIRKCCPTKNYFNIYSNECEAEDNDKTFANNIYQFLLNFENKTLLTKSQKLKECSKISQKLNLDYITNNTSHVLLEAGKVHDYDRNISFNFSQYCLEMVGDTPEMSSLVIVYCSEPQIVVPKCCPKGHYFDTRVLSCSPFYNADDDEGDATLLQVLNEGTTLSHEGDLLCNDIPVKISLNETILYDNVLCTTTKNQHCYNSDEFCVDNVLNVDENGLVHSAFVCPKNFVNKCCSDGLSLHKSGCTKAFKQSLSLVHILKNSRYQVKSISHLGSQCSPIIIEENMKSDIKWALDSHHFAVIKNMNDTIRTRNFCIDDFISGEDVFLVIKVCSEEVKEYHEISSIENWSENVLGKCCPGNMLYHPQVSENNDLLCVEKNDSSIDSFKEEFLERHNISHLIFANFPDCSIKEYYHKFTLEPTYDDHAELIADRSLKIISKENNCKIKATQIDSSKFCVDFVMRNNVYKPIAIVCTASKTYHTERNAIFVILVGLSCAALISTFFSLIFMRVRRGMVTVKKVNTLAGRILTSYVLCQLIGYLVLGIGALADFKEETNKCFVLVGFLMFFMIAAFCWNTSICLEGLLLTMHIQTPETHRYIYHSLWAWGVPGTITAAALIKDFNRDALPCDSITPKIGLGQCFFSDLLARLLYFYLPISTTVILNGFLLVYAKILRKKKLKKLEKDPNRVRRHENLQQVLSIKSIKRKIRGEPSIKPVSNHSGLRMHHKRNIWIESIKLVLWSGTTWLMEIIGTVVMMYKGRPQGEWYSYLWYLPVGFNCLRGLGIFIIICFTPDNKVRLKRTARFVSTRFNTTLSRFMPTIRFGGTNKTSNKGLKSMNLKWQTPNNDQLTYKSEPNTDLNKERKTRSTSVSTIITNLSSSTLEPSSGEVSDSQMPQYPTFYQSISQIDSRPSSWPTLPEVFEGFETDNEINISRQDTDEVSLDNTSMENVFWEHNFREKRNERRFTTNFEDSDILYLKHVNLIQCNSISGKEEPENNIYEKLEKRPNNSCSMCGQMGFEEYDYCTRL